LIPHLGSAITTWLWGGFAVGDATLNRFFSLHYLLPFAIAAVVGLHIWALHVPGNNNPLGIDVKGPQDTLPFHPYYTMKDAFYLSLFVIVFAGFVFFAPNFFGNPDNYTQANPLVTPPDIVPEWYLLPFYAMLRSVPQKLIGVLVLAGALVTPVPGAVAGHLEGAILPLPSADEAVLLALRAGLPAARLYRLAGRGRGARPRRHAIAAGVAGAGGHGLLLRLFLRADAADRPDRKAQDAAESIAKSVLGAKGERT